MQEVIIPELEELMKNAENLQLRRYWSDEDKRVVEKYYGKVPTLDLAKFLGRSKHAVEVQAGLMGLKFGK